MKKLFKLLAALILTSGASATVVACGFGRFDKATLSDKLKNQIIAAINATNNQDAQYYGKYTFGDIFSSSSETETLALRLVNQVISSYFYGSNFANWASWAGATLPTDAPTAFGKMFQNLVTSLAINQLYQDYVTAFAQNKYLDYQMVDSDYNISYSPPPTPPTPGNTVPWTLPDIYYVSTYNQKTGVPRALTTQPGARSTYADVKKDLFEPKDGLATLKKQMAETYHDYLYRVEIPKVIDQIIGDVYLQYQFLNLYQNSSTKKVYISQNSQLISQMMNWPTSPGPQKTFSSNFYMIWEYKVPISIASAMETKIGTLQTPAVTNKTWNPTFFKNFINPATPSPTNPSLQNESISKNGADPIFGIPGFAGFAAYNSSGTVVNGFKPNDLYQKQILGAGTTRNKTGFIYNPTYSRYWFNSGPTDKYATFAFRLPIFIPDLLSGGEDKGSSITFQNSDKTQKYEPITLKDYSNPDVTPPDLSWTGLGAGAKTRDSVDYLYDGAAAPSQTSNNFATFGTYTYSKQSSQPQKPVYESDGAINPALESQRLQLMQEAEYAYGQTSAIETLAKDRFYSLAFNYNKKNIYSSNLYNDIGKYIQEKQD